MNRRDFLRLSGLAGLAALAAAGRSQAQDAVLATLPRDRVMHAIQRLTYGVTPALYAYVHQIGVEAYLEEQLEPQALADNTSDDLLTFFPAIDLSAAEMLRTFREDMGIPSQHLVGATLTRAIYSQRQLYERMVGFWSDHFSIYLLAEGQQFLKPVDDRQTIRPHALGHFRDLLGASAHSPAMLLYLDNALSQAEHPNENYGRELLELHTLGVNGGYTEDDVRSVARAFTGWSVVGLRDIGEPGVFRFRQGMHDSAEKTVLGVTLPSGRGQEDGEQVLDILAGHPSTARFIAFKLARRFAADQPSDVLVQALADVFTQTNGDTRAVLRALTAHEDFWNTSPKFKRPLEYTISLIRALDIPPLALIGAAEALFAALQTMGHVPFFWAPPNGYPDVGAYWMSNLLPRWNLAIEAVLNGQQMRTLGRLVEENGAGQDLDAAVRFLGRYLYGRDLSDAEYAAAVDFGRSTSDDLREQALAALALLLAAPAFQYA